MENPGRAFEAIKPNDENFQLKISDFEGDIRALVLASSFKKTIDMNEINQSLKGAFSYYYKKMGALRKIMLFIILTVFLMQKPYWCVSKGSDIQDTCEIDADGVEYNMVITTFINPRTSFIVTFGIMYFLIVSQVLKVQHLETEDSLETIKMYLQVTLFAVSLCISLMETFNFLPRSDITSIFRILFTMVYFRSLLVSFYKIGRMLMKSMSMVILLFATLFVFSVLGSVIFEADDIGSDEIIYAYSFTNLFRTMETLLLLMRGENFPGVLIDSIEGSVFHLIFLIIFMLISAKIIGSFFSGVFFFHFKSYYIENLRKVEAKYPVFTECIAPVLQERFMNPRYTDDIVKIVEDRQRIISDEENVRKIRMSYKQKLRNAINKIKGLNVQSKQVYFNRMKSVFDKISQSFFYKFLSFLLNFYLVLMPIIIIDRQSITESADYLQMSELISFIFAVDLYLRYAFTKKRGFWGFMNVTDLISVVGVIFFSSVLFVIPVNYWELDPIGPYALYICWSFSAFLKFFRLHYIMTISFTSYKVIVKTCIHIVPLILDLISIYLIVVLFYATLGLTMFGGVINTGFPSKYETVVGEELDMAEINLSFNDLTNSMVYLVTMNISYFMTGIQKGLAASAIVSNSSFYLFLTRVYFYSFMIITEMIIIDLIIGFIMEFLEQYSNNSKELLLREQIIANKQNLIDVLLDQNKELTPEEEKQINPSVSNADQSISEDFDQKAPNKASKTKNKIEEADEEEEDDDLSEDSVLKDFDRYVKEDV